MLRVYHDEEKPAELHVIADANNERKKRQRAIQVNTAKRVLKRFWVDRRGRLEKGTQTIPDEIGAVKNYYED